MVSREERGAYGFTHNVQNWDKYNPLGNRVTPFPTEKMCSFCESRCDVIFPIAPKLCGRCTNRILGRKDVFVRVKPKMDLAGYKCDWCGSISFMPTQVNTRICHRCTDTLAKQTQANQLAKFARKVI
jgi:hypothetical protein